MVWSWRTGRAHIGWRVAIQGLAAPAPRIVVTGLVVDQAQGGRRRLLDRSRAIFNMKFLIIQTGWRHRREIIIAAMAIKPGFQLVSMASDVPDERIWISISLSAPRSHGGAP